MVEVLVVSTAVCGTSLTLIRTSAVLAACKHVSPEAGRLQIPILVALLRTLACPSALALARLSCAYYFACSLPLLVKAACRVLAQPSLEYSTVV